MTETNAHAGLLTRKEAAAYLRISTTQFDRERKKGRYVPTGFSSARRPLWRAAALDVDLGSLNPAAEGDTIMLLIDAHN